MHLKTMLSAALVCLIAVSTVTIQAADKNEAISLYNGKNLDGWKVVGGNPNSWKANGELLSCVAPGGGWLQTKKMYSDFMLELEYKIPAEGNSGVALRVPEDGHQAHDGMEIQILDDNAQKYQKMNLKPSQFTGGIYYQAAAKQGAAKGPEEWNKYQITCRGPFITIELNGKVINEVDIDEYTTGKGNKRPLAERPRIGMVGLQSHGTQVDFRNVKLTDLTKSIEDGLRYIDLVEGTGKTVPQKATVKVHYTGWLANGKKFDSSRDRGEPIEFGLDGVIKGWTLGLPGMKVGGRRQLIIPSDYGYGARGAGRSIPPNSMLIFDIELLDVR